MRVPIVYILATKIISYTDRVILFNTLRGDLLETCDPLFTSAQGGRLRELSADTIQSDVERHRCFGSDAGWEALRQDQSFMRISIGCDLCY
jgi:hypothetical protein